MINREYYDILDRYADFGFIIILQASKDWFKARSRLEEIGDGPGRNKQYYQRLYENCNKFFLSNWFEKLCQYKYDGEALLEKFNRLWDSGTRKLYVSDANERSNKVQEELE